MKVRGQWLRDNPLCVECTRKGSVTRATEVDHIVPLADGGADDVTNYQSMCVECHKRKTGREARSRG